MMNVDDTAGMDIVGEFKRLMALTTSLQARQQEYEEALQRRNREIDTLQSLLNEANDHRSRLDNSVQELEDLQSGLKNLQQQSSFTNYSNLAAQHTKSAEDQLASLQQQYTELQAYCRSLQEQLIELSNQNLSLQQQTARSTELQSLLNNAEEEINKLKQGSPKE